MEMEAAAKKKVDVELFGPLLINSNHAPQASELPPPSSLVSGLPNAQKQAEEKKYYSK